VVYENDWRGDGAVLYPDGLPGIFKYPTAIEPRDSTVIAYDKVRGHVGNLPADFQARLVEAVRFNNLMGDDSRQVIYDAIGVAAPPPI
jgi:hypothetical protein